MEQMTLAQAVKKTFFPPDVKAVEVIKEMKALTPQDKEDFKNEFLKVGIQIIQSPV